MLLTSKSIPLKVSICKLKSKTIVRSPIMAQSYPDSDFSDEDLSPLDVSFNKAAEHLRKITNKLDNNQLLELYGLFKQGTEGKCNVPKPGWLDGRGRKKWEAWNSLGDLPKDEAKHKYINVMHKLDPELEIVEKKGPKEIWVAVSSMQYDPEPELKTNELTILEAARENCGDRVTELLTKNPELQHTKDEDGLTALHWAADRDATISLSAALKGGCDVNAVDESGQTALHYASMCGNIRSVKILIEAGACMIKDCEDYTPIDVAADDEIRKVLESVAK